MEKFRTIHFVLQKNYTPTKPAFWCIITLNGIVWNSGCLDYSEIPNISLLDLQCEDFFKKKQENARFLTIYATKG